jgi:hypothetical protein
LQVSIVHNLRASTTTKSSLFRSFCSLGLYIVYLHNPSAQAQVCSRTTDTTKPFQADNRATKARRCRIAAKHRARARSLRLPPSPHRVGSACLARPECGVHSTSPDDPRPIGAGGTLVRRARLRKLPSFWLGSSPPPTRPRFRSAASESRRTRGCRRFACGGRWRAGGGLPLFGCQVELQHAFFSSFLFWFCCGVVYLLCFRFPQSRRGSTVFGGWGLGRTKGCLGDMRVSETCEKMRRVVCGCDVFSLLCFCLNTNMEQGPIRKQKLPKSVQNSDTKLNSIAMLE